MRRRPRNSGKFILPLNVADMMTDCASFSMEVQGSYFQLLMYSWRVRPIPDDDVALARLCRMSLCRWKRNVAPLLRPLFEVENGALISPRLEDERERVEQNIAQKRTANLAKNARKTGSKSGHKSDPECSDNSDVGVAVGVTERPRNATTPTPTPSPNKNKKESSPSESRQIDPPPVDLSQGEVLPTADVVRLPVSDLEEAVALWNSLAAELGMAQVQKLTDDRRPKLRARLKDCGGLEGWRALLEKVRASDFLRGMTGRWIGRGADFDFFLSPAKFARTMEGSYDNRIAEENGWDTLRRGMEERGML